MITNHAERTRPLLLRPPEAAELAGVSRALGYRWAQNGVWPSVRVGRTVRIPYNALLQWIESNTNKPAA